ncbi:MAG: 50S ribosomal protein L3 [Alphaproteobacteria bacterium]|nr:50S ribosomal protein L3 [Alphaproteobacteria bacterium]
MANSQMGLLGTKLGMTQLFQEDGNVLPVTVLQVGPCRVLQVKSTEGSDGYDALQLGFGTQKAHRVSKAFTAHAKKTGESLPRWVSEVRVTADVASQYQPGQEVGAADVFETGTKVDVTGVSKGRGFAGVMKRYNFKGFIRTHGTHEFFRHGGSIGTRLTPGMVLKGKKMPGRMGGEQVTVQNLDVVKVDAERGLVFVRGGVPGPKGAFVKVRKAVKAQA